MLLFKIISFFFCYQGEISISTICVSVCLCVSLSTCLPVFKSPIETSVRNLSAFEYPGLRWNNKKCHFFYKVHPYLKLPGLHVRAKGTGDVH